MVAFTGANVILQKHTDNSGGNTFTAFNSPT
jgi:hypothetical protein